MDRYIKNHVKRILTLGSRWLSRYEFLNQSLSRYNERSVEYAFLFQKISNIYPDRILDVGTGTTSLPSLMRKCGFIVYAIDNIKDYWPFGMVNRHYHIIDDDITNTHLTQEFDLISCISVLEHIEQSDEAIKNMVLLLKPGGDLILTFPYSEKAYIRNVYDLSGSRHRPGRPYITQSFSRENLQCWAEDYHLDIIDQEYWQFWDGEYWTIGNQIIPPVKTDKSKKHQLTCIHFKRM